MECNYSQIERVFSDYIIKLIGPSVEQDQFRQSRFLIVKNVLEKAFREQGITPHIFSFGSFPIRTYLPESDMDVTIILEDAGSQQILNNFLPEYQNK
jgi:DNA polymerase sigma